MEPMQPKKDMTTESVPSAIKRATGSNGNRFRYPTVASSKRAQTPNAANNNPPSWKLTIRGL